ncbi:MAG: hypothetical protein HZA54_21015 [Planctomycetes bacterium]|nr:hypothetical protein [Planctomycetota bacterium]
MHVRSCRSTVPAARIEGSASVVLVSRTRTRTRMPRAFEYEYEYEEEYEEEDEDERDRRAITPPRCAGSGGPMLRVAGAVTEGTRAFAILDMHSLR